MDGLSAAASGMAVVSLALQLAGGLIKLYDFWGTVQDAPAEVGEMLMDLKLLSRILNELVNRKDPGTHVQDALEHCDGKVQLLLSIVREFEPDFSKHSGRVRLWKAFKAARKEKKLRRFRDSLQETKTTLLLALVPQFQMPPAYVEGEQVQTNTSISTKKDAKKSSVVVEVERVPDSDLPPPCYEAQDSVYDVEDNLAEIPPTTKPNFRKMATDFPEAELQACLGNALQIAAENYFRGGAFERAMSETVHRVATIQTTYHYGAKDKSSEDSDDFNPTPHQPSSAETLDIVRSRSQHRRASQSRICRRTTATGVVLGTVWLRTTSVQVNSNTGKSIDIVSSFTFFPSWWLTKVGVKYGVEANLFATATGWQFNFNPIRAVPDDSPIFNACRKGNLSTVQFLLSEGDASVRDTNSKGWTPLHFASLAESETSVDICEYLISEGADKTALVFEGPSENALSPVTIFTATGKKRPADMKIKMLRLFEDCIDMSEPESDGWTIIADLVSAFNLEDVPQISNSITWFLRTLKPQSMVAFGPKTLWHGLQHAVRAFIDMEQKGMIVRKRLNSIVGDKFPVSYGISIAYWIALVAISKSLMPMLLIAGSMMHVEGYDYDPESQIDPTVLAKQLPYLYEAWGKALTESIETMDEVLNSEFDATLEETGWSDDLLRDFKAKIDTPEKLKSQSQQGCSVCLDDYSLLGHGLVEPRWVTFLECVGSRHKRDCSCQELLDQYKAIGYLQPSSTHVRNNTNDSDSEDEVFHDAESDPTDSKKSNNPDENSWVVDCERLLREVENGKGKRPFQEVTAHLYRCHARVWLGSYQTGEMLCASCFLQGEGYIDKESKEDWDLSSSMPASFVS